MNMKFITAPCACCGKVQTFDIDTDPVSEKTTKFSLQNYLDFKNVRLNICEHCGYVAPDISKLIGPATKTIVGTDNYETVLDDGFMKGYEKLPYEDYVEYDVGAYEAYSMLCRADKNYFELAKSTARTSDLKEMLAGIYFENKIEREEDDNPLYDKLCNRLSKQSKAENEECLTAMKEVVLDHPFELIFVAERLTKILNYEKAQKLIDRVKEQVTLDKDLDRYVENFMTEVEVI